MTIERLGPLDPVSQPSKRAKVGNTTRATEADSINLSEEARSMNDLQRAVEIVRAAPDVRLDRIEEVKKKLEDPNYINKEVIEQLADRIMKSFGIG